jgi:hypothetical protein
MELGLPAALVEDSAQQAEAVIHALAARRAPWLPGYRVRVLDGNHLSATEHRLEELRTTWAAPLPGTVLAVLAPETGLAIDVFLTPDGHAQERSLLDEVLAHVQERDVWIADRNFCTLKFLFEIAKKLGVFVMRQHGTVKGKLCGRRVFQGEGPTPEKSTSRRLNSSTKAKPTSCAVTPLNCCKRRATATRACIC